MDRREREQSRYRRGMASDTGRKGTQKMQELYTPTCLILPPKTLLWNIKEAGDEPMIDILPYTVGKGNPFADPGMFYYERTYWCHKGVGPDNRWYVCPRDTAKLPCPICEYRQQLREDPTADKKTIDALAPSRRQLFNVIDCNHREKGVQVWDFSYAMFGKLLATYLGKERLAEKLKNWCEFEGGLSLSLGIEKKSFEGNKFIEVKLIDFEERRKDYDADEMLKKVYCLDECIRLVPYSELKKVFLQTGEETEGTKHKFKESDVNKIDEMTDRELTKFIIVNDIDLNPEKFDNTEALAAAVKKEIQEALEQDEEPKSSKKKGKKDEDEEPEEPTENEIEVGSSVTWTDEEGDDKAGTVKKIKGDQATIEDDDDNTYKVDLDQLALAEEEPEEPEEEPAEIEEGSDVKWMDDEQEEHEGTITELKGRIAVVKEGKKSYKVKLSELALA